MNMVMRHVPYLQANFVLGLDTDEGDEPFEISTEQGWGGCFEADIAEHIAQGLLRDAGPIVASEERSEAR